MSFALADRVKQAGAGMGTGSKAEVAPPPITPKEFSLRAWAKRQPASGHFRCAVLEIADRLEECPEKAFVELTNRELAAAIFATTRTAQNLQDRLGLPLTRKV